ncbi:MAG: PHP domain-containing protein [Cytophagales bacterium]|nr:PHP domain-containing protein [Cytophagales bacterium]
MHTPKEVLGLMEEMEWLAHVHLEELPWKNWTHILSVLRQTASDTPWTHLPSHILSTKILQTLKKTGSLALRDKLISQTPIGVRKLFGIRGLTPRRVRSFWKELGIVDLQSLYAACEAGRVGKLKGLGSRTEQKLLNTIGYVLHYQHHLRWDQAESWDLFFQKIYETLMGEKDSQENFMVSHEVEEVLGELVYSCFCPDRELLLSSLGSYSDLRIEDDKGSPFSIRGRVGSRDTPFHIRCLRRTPVLSRDSQDLSPIRLRGILHVHTTYSDGKHSLEEQALYCQRQGYEYVGISDHSISAFYAGGLDLPKIQSQHQEIDKLNRQLFPFRIFKGIEVDILKDGSLDYPDEVLRSFDFTIASIHSVLDMGIEKATQRILTALSHPYTTFLGHPTGRILLERPGYPLDHERLLTACAHHHVIPEINANPRRLDLDWRWIGPALERGLQVSIHPDAHEKKGIHDVSYGILMARKGGAQAQHIFNTSSVDEVDSYFLHRREST